MFKSLDNIDSRWLGNLYSKFEKRIQNRHTFIFASIQVVKNGKHPKSLRSGCVSVYNVRIQENKISLDFLVTFLAMKKVIDKKIDALQWFLYSHYKL